MTVLAPKIRATFADDQDSENPGGKEYIFTRGMGFSCWVSENTNNPARFTEDARYILSYDTIVEILTVCGERHHPGVDFRKVMADTHPDAIWDFLSELGVAGGSEEMEDDEHEEPVAEGPTDNPGDS